jgi:hypothetical protein
MAATMLGDTVPVSSTTNAQPGDGERAKMTGQMLTS